MDEAIVERIQMLALSGKLRWTNHIVMRLAQRGITTDDVEYVLRECELIELYPESHPHPAYLVLGVTATGKPLHVVCGVATDELWLITAYFPDKDEWESSFKKRKGQE